MGKSGQCAARDVGGRERHRKSFNTEDVRGPRSATGDGAYTDCGGNHQRTLALRRRALKAEAPFLPRPTVTLAHVVSPPSWPGLTRPSTPCLRLVPTRSSSAFHAACRNAGISQSGRGHDGALADGVARLLFVVIAFLPNLRRGVGWLHRSSTTRYWCDSAAQWTPRSATESSGSCCSVRARAGRRAKTPITTSRSSCAASRSAGPKLTGWWRSRRTCCTRSAHSCMRCRSERAPGRSGRH
jgi:hypothetical protein